MSSITSKKLLLTEILKPGCLRQSTYSNLLVAIEACRDERMLWRRGEPVVVADVLNLSEQMLRRRRRVGELSLTRLRDAITSLGLNLVEKDADLPK